MAEPRTPQDHKAAAATPDNEADFTYTTEAGETFTVPDGGELPVGFARSIRKLPQEDQIFTILERLCDEETLAKIDTMTGREFGEFFKAWQAHAEANGRATLGK
jgi:hypothetical protein